MAPASASSDTLLHLLLRAHRRSEGLLLVELEGEAAANLHTLKQQHRAAALQEKGAALQVRWGSWEAAQGVQGPACMRLCDQAPDQRPGRPHREHWRAAAAAAPSFRCRGVASHRGSEHQVPRQCQPCRLASTLSPCPNRLHLTPPPALPARCTSWPAV